MYFGMLHSPTPAPTKDKEVEARLEAILHDNGPPLMIDDKAASTQHRKKQLCFSVDGYDGCGS